MIPDVCTERIKINLYHNPIILKSIASSDRENKRNYLNTVYCRVIYQNKNRLNLDNVIFKGDETAWRQQVISDDLLTANISGATGRLTPVYNPVKN